MTNDSETRDLATIVDRIPLLRIVLSSIGTLGSLIALGYLIDDAQRTLLGIEVSPTRSTTDYATMGGAFFVDVIGVVWQHPVLAAVCVIGVVLCALAIGAVSPRARKNRLAWGVAVTLVLAAFALNAFWADLPIMQMRNLLSNPPLCERSDESVTRQHATWVRVLCSRAEENETLKARLAEQDIDCPAAPWSTAKNRKSVAATTTATETATVAPSPTRTSAHNWFTLEQQFTVNVVVTLFLTYLALALYGSTASAALRPATAAALRAVLLIVAVVNALALPYVYGKVIRPTRFPKGHVLYQIVDVQAAQPAPDKLAITITNPLALIIAQDAGLLTFYNLDKDPQPQKPTQTFLQIDRKTVLQVAVDGSDDLVAARAIDYLESTPCQ